MRPRFSLPHDSCLEYICIDMDSPKALSQPRPRVVVSRCLNFEACRYNAQSIQDQFVAKLAERIDVITVCPEVEIGLGIPRDPVRIVVGKTGRRYLKQPNTSRDLTKLMKQFSADYLHSLQKVDGFVLKGRSPSCGIKDVKQYSNETEPQSLGKSAGFFGEAVLKHFSHLAVEDEGRLNNFRIREHFLTKLYMRARFRQLQKRPSMKALVNFHTEHKLLFMAYSQKELRCLGRIVANSEQRPLTALLESYAEALARAFVKMARFSSHINVLMHGLGYFSKQLTARERAHFLTTLEAYRTAKVPLSQPIGILQSWIQRFEEAYLAQQAYFDPYPLDLVEITDSGKGRGAERS